MQEAPVQKGNVEGSMQETPVQKAHVRDSCKRPMQETHFEDSCTKLKQNDRVGGPWSLNAIAMEKFICLYHSIPQISSTEYPTKYPIVFPILISLSLPISIFRLFLLPFALGCIGLFFLLGQICALGVAAVYGLIILGQKYVDRSGIQQWLLPLGDWLLICFSHLLLAFVFRVQSFE